MLSIVIDVRFVPLPDMDGARKFPRRHMQERQGFIIVPHAWRTFVWSASRRDRIGPSKMSRLTLGSISVRAGRELQKAQAAKKGGVGHEW